MKRTSYEMVTPRLAVLPVDQGRWKVTARFTLRVTATKTIACVRVRGPYGHGGNAPVLYLAEPEFKRLFRPEKR